MKITVTVANMIFTIAFLADAVPFRFERRRAGDISLDTGRSWCAVHDTC